MTLISHSAHAPAPYPRFFVRSSIVLCSFNVPLNVFKTWAVCESCFSVVSSESRNITGWLKYEQMRPLVIHLIIVLTVILVLSSAEDSCWSGVLTCWSPNSSSVGLLWFFLHLLCISFDERKCCWWANTHFHIPPSLIWKERETARLTNGLILNLQTHCTFGP